MLASAIAFATLSISCGVERDPIVFDAPLDAGTNVVVDPNGEDRAVGSVDERDDTARSTLVTTLRPPTFPRSSEVTTSTTSTTSTSLPPLDPVNAPLIEWNGTRRYIHGANLAWVNFGCDFGCGADGGVSSPEVQAIVADAFVRARAADMTHVRWWLFPEAARHITVDEDGLPTGFGPSVFADIDAALVLAEQAELDLILTLFAGPLEMPSAWLATAQGRSRLVNVLDQLFQRYSDHPRIMTWQVMNEPEWAIWGGAISAEIARELVIEVAASVHRNTSALVSVGGARLDGIVFWSDVDLDYLTVHWYDNMTARPQCLPCATYADIQAATEIDVPILVGEFFLGGPEPLARLERFRDHGFAGALAWSLLPDRTNDLLTIDLAAAAEFAGQLDTTEAEDIPPSQLVNE